MTGPSGAPPHALQDWDDKVVDVLQLVVQQCPEASRPETLCSLLQVSRACRRAVQQSTGHLQFDSNWLPSPMSVASFAAWLPCHAGLVKHLAVHWRGGNAEVEHLQGSLMTMALQQCADAPATATARAAAAAAAVGAAAQGNSVLEATHVPLPLQLQSFSTNCIATPAVMRVLAGSPHLTHLDLWDLSSGNANMALCAALGRLRTLKQLHCNMQHTDAVPPALVSAVGTLPQLTQLYISPIMPAALQSLPCQLQVLTISVEVSTAPDVSCDLDLSHIKGLRQLELSSKNGAPLSSMQLLVPSQLTCLTINNPVGSLRGSQELQELSLSVVNSNSLSPLLPQASMPLHMPKLVSLSVQLDISHGDGSHYNADELQQASLAIGRISRLTRLRLTTHGRLQDLGDGTATFRNVDWCGPLQQLKGLRHLDIGPLSLRLEAVLQLSCLTSLQHLKLSGNPSVDDFVAVALASKLSNLRVLGIINCDLRSMALIPAVTSITGLECLDLSDNTGLLMTDAGLYMLRSCVRLMQLWLPWDAADTCTDAGLNALQHALPGLKIVIDPTMHS